MASRAELIMQAIVSKLTTPAMSSVAAANIYRDPTGPLDQSVNAAVVVEEGDETAPDISVISIAYRELEVRLTAMARAKPAGTAADLILVEAHNRLIADQTLGGHALRIREGETRRQRDDLERDIALFTKTYHIEYRTAETSLET